MSDELNGVWLDHICAEGFNGKWTLHYLTDDEVKKCYNALHTTPPVSESEALEVQCDMRINLGDNQKWHVASIGQDLIELENLHGEIRQFKPPYQALQRESVDLESLKLDANKSNERWAMNEVWNNCLDHLLENHKGKIIK